MSYSASHDKNFVEVAAVKIHFLHQFIMLPTELEEGASTKGGKQMSLEQRVNVVALLCLKFDGKSLHHGANAAAARASKCSKHAVRKT